MYYPRSTSRVVLSDHLPPQPADIPPFDMVVDDVQWRVPANRTSPRPQSPAKQAAILKHITALLAQGIIEPSTSAYYSQVLLVPKPNGDYRLCIDYRNINKCQMDAAWPIPHIQEMLQRIGLQKPTVFGCVDMTQGYHQAPLTLAARDYTSFILYSGVYRFTRVPFGPKRAPSYFQEQMASVVLNGLIYSICEMYIDDCNIFATTDDEFVTRLRLVFQRFRKHKLFLKAIKCYFGFAELEFVGKVLTEKGLKMSQSKIQSVLDFPIPIVSRQLDSSYPKILILW
jgi:Reverse transcriptase (RNA-dependent DNA polymerase)